MGRNPIKLAALAIAISLLVPAVAGAKPRALLGTQFRDFIVGTPGPDRILLGARDDRGFGARGADLLRGGGGDDRLRGGRGRDRLAGGPGGDWLHGGRGIDGLRSGRGADLIDARDRRRDRRIRGGPGNDVCLLDPAEVRRARGCERIAVPRDPRAARSYSIWRPGPRDGCPAWLHDSYSVVGPDARRYPSWHPPRILNPATRRRCTFGHEHGRDPRGSELFGWLRSHFARSGRAAEAGIPFGLANEALDELAGPDGGHQPRHEDHVGHKLEWENDVQLERGAGGERVGIGVRCDLLVKLHQGSHSADALGNNVHELTYAVRCDDGTALIATVLGAFGEPNSFLRSCDPGTVVPAGTAHSLPAGGGARLIPDRHCVEQHLLVPEGQLSDYGLGLYESWISSIHLRGAGGAELAHFNPEFAVLNPSRYALNAPAGSIARALGACFETEPETGDRARGGYCEAARSYAGPLAWDSPQSGFDGARREVRFNQTELVNPGGPTRWFTDPYGRGASTAPFPGSIRQLIAPVDNRRDYPLAPQAFGADRPYGGAGVHAPN